MPTLEKDQLVFRFPKIEEDAAFSIDFQRTLRIPDTDATYDLPPGLGRFPLRHADDYPATLPRLTLDRGGIIMPMWQAEALWLNFHNTGSQRGLDFPVAIKIAAGKINAITGQTWQPGLFSDPQDYMVSPDQPWLDGFAIEKGIIRQFVAMPLGDGYSTEEQLTDAAHWGGLQISVTPLKKAVWQRLVDEYMAPVGCLEESFPVAFAVTCREMGLGGGGRMRQILHPDPFDLEDWDTEATARVFVTLVHAKDWKSTTGEAAPQSPPTAQDYARASLPWFTHYGVDQAALPGANPLAGMKSVAAVHKEQTGATLPNSDDIKTGPPLAIGPGANAARRVRTSGAWEKQ